MLTDPVADMLTRIRNAVRAGHESVRMPSSQMKVGIAKILREEGYVKYFKVVRAGSVKRNPKAGDKKDRKPLSHDLLIVYLKYGPAGEPVISQIQRASKPGLRRYVKADKIPRTLGGLGMSVISTSRGLMSDKDARKQHVGGELVCNVW